MKKAMLFISFTIGLSLLSACGSTEDMTDYVGVSFSGMDSQGSAIYEVDTTGLVEEIFDFEGLQDYPDDKTAKEAGIILNAYQIKMEPEEDLSNGDEVTLTISVDEEKTDKIKGGEKKFTVEGLEEPNVLTTKDVEENLVLNFNGVSGRGVAQIDKIFDESFLNNLHFEVENDGELKNGDKAVINAGEGSTEILNSNGYILDEDFQPTFEVKNLDVVAEKATDIKNLEDIERFIDEELNGKYEDTDYTYGSNTMYKIEQEKLMYRQFDKDSNNESGFNGSVDNNGNLIGVFSIEEYRIESDDEKKLKDEFTVIYGFSGIILDEDNKANISELGKVNEQKGDNYSLESVIQLYEGEGYEEVKK